MNARALAWILAGVFVAAVAPFLTQLHHNFDEGLYIFQAHYILAGELPYRDFFYHQTPLYPFTLALVGWPAQDSVLPYRLLSAAATALAGVAVFRFARALVGDVPGLLAALLFLTSPLQFWGLLALPNALMVWLCTAGVALVWLEERRGLIAVGAVLVALSILYKPLTVGCGAALSVALLAAPSQRSKVPILLAAGVGTGLIAWAFFHLTSEGLFTDVLLLQSSRYAGEGGFEVMRAFAPFAERLERDGIHSATAWNWHEHVRAFWLDRERYPNWPLALLGGGGLVLLWSPLGRRWATHRLLLTLWWLFPLGLSIFVWEPVWDHYFVQYLPALAVLASLPLALAWETPRARLPARAAALVVVAWLATLGPSYIALRRTDYGPLADAGARGETWLTWDPFLNVVSGTAPACGIIDWMNVYGEHSLTAGDAAADWRRHHVEPETLIACLEADPSIRIGRGFWSVFYADEALRRWMETQPPERFVSLRGF